MQLDVYNKNLDLSAYGNGQQYFLKEPTVVALSINYPEYALEIAGVWIRVDKGENYYQSTGVKKLLFEFKSFEFQK